MGGFSVIEYVFITDPKHVRIHVWASRGPIHTKYFDNKIIYVNLWRFLLVRSGIILHLATGIFGSM